MNILILSSSTDSQKCSYRIFLRTATLMAEKGHQVTVIFPRQATPAKPIAIENVKIVYTPDFLPARLRSGGFGLFDMLAKTIAVLRTKFDVVHACPGHRPAGLIPAFFARRLRKSVVVDEWWEWFGNEGIATVRKGFIGKLIAGYDSVLEIPAKAVFDGVVAISNTLKNRLNSDSNVIVLNGGAECDKFIAYDLNVARQKTNLPSDIFIIGMSNVSKDDHDDNLPFFEALAELSKSYSDLRLLVTGDPKYVQGALRPLFPHNILVDCGWPDFESYNRFLSACDIFALPYPNRPRNAGRWPNKIGDYLSLNRPVITNPTGDVGVLFNKYALGFLCQNTSKHYEQLIASIVDNRAKLDQANTDSLAVASGLLSFPERVAHILRFYESILASPRSGRLVE